MISVWCFTEFYEQVYKFKESEYSAHIFEAWLLSSHQNNIDGCLLIHLVLAFNAAKIYFIGNTFGYKSGANVIISQKFENNFVILLLEWSVIIITSDFMVKVVEVYFEKNLSDTSQKDICKFVKLYFINEIFNHKLLHLEYLLIQWHQVILKQSL